MKVNQSAITKSARERKKKKKKRTKHVSRSFDDDEDDHIGIGYVWGSKISQSVSLVGLLVSFLGAGRKLIRSIVFV